jgi:hypothetical protein
MKEVLFMMGQYIFLTAEGSTVAPNGDDVDNLQVLGFAYGQDIESARLSLLESESWILNSGFSKHEMKGFEVCERCEWATS